MEQAWMRWTLSLALGFPLLMLFLGELSYKLEQRNSRLAELVNILRILVLPSLALFIICFKVLQLHHDHLWVKISETLVWIALVYWGLTLINSIIFQETKVGSWRSKIPKLFQDLSRTFWVLVGSAIILSTIWDADLAGLITALGVGSLVIGLALQDSLGNIFSGMTLLLERPIAIGDWVEIGDIQGQIKEITWRSVQVYTLEKHLVIVPNSQIAQGNLRNFSRPEPVHGVNIDLGFSCDDPPNKVIKVLYQTALETQNVLRDPEPSVSLEEYGDFSMIYRTLFFVRDYEQGIDSSHDFRVRIWYASQRHNLTMPYPTSVEYEYQSPLPVSESESPQAIALLRQVPGWDTLEATVLESTYETSTIETFAQGEMVILQQEPLRGLFLILDGKAEMYWLDEQRQKRVLGNLFPGEIFGEKSILLSDQVSETNILAIEDLKVLLISIETLQSMIHQFPLLASSIGEIMELRRQQLKAISL